MAVAAIAACSAAPLLVQANWQDGTPSITPARREVPLLCDQGTGLTKPVFPTTSAGKTKSNRQAGVGLFQSNEANALSIFRLGHCRPITCRDYYETVRAVGATETLCCGSLKM